jgi:hypothetical protein
MPSPTPAPASRERSWLHWGLLVTGLYVTWFIALTLPLLMVCFPREFIARGPRVPIDVFKEWQYWVIIALLALSQFLFLRVPVRIATRRPVSRKSIWLPVLMSGLWCGGLVLGGCAGLAELFRKSDGFNPWWCLGAAVTSWLVWSVVFYFIGRASGPEEAIRQQSRWLLRGSILELLIAVPSHIVARGRGECCAGILTFFGITMGISVMLLSFGPAVFLLYHARWRRLRPAP